MYVTVKCPYCKGRQQIDIRTDEIENGNKYYDCQHCLESFEITVKATAKQINGSEVMK